MKRVKKDKSSINKPVLFILLAIIIIITAVLIFKFNITGRAISNLPYYFYSYNSFPPPRFNIRPYQTILKGNGELILKIINVPSSRSFSDAVVSMATSTKKEDIFYLSGGEYYFYEGEIKIPLLYENLPNSLVKFSFSLIETSGKSYSQQIYVKFQSPNQAYPTPTQTSQPSKDQQSPNPSPQNSPQPPQPQQPEPSDSPYCNCKSIELITPYDNNGKPTNPNTISEAINNFKAVNPKFSYTAASLNPTYKGNFKEVQDWTPRGMRPRKETTGGEMQSGFIIKAICEVSTSDNIKGKEILKRCIEGQELQLRRKDSYTTYDTNENKEMDRCSSSEGSNTLVKSDDSKATCYKGNVKLDEQGNPYEDETQVETCKKNNQPSPGFTSDDFSHESEDKIYKKLNPGDPNSKVWLIQWIDTPKYKLENAASGSAYGETYFHAYVNGDDCATTKKCNICFILQESISVSNSAGREGGNVGSDTSKPNYVKYIKLPSCNSL